MVRSMSLFYFAGYDQEQDVQFVINGKSRKLFIRGYSFTRKVLRDRYTIWECCQSKPLDCKAGATTYIDGSRVNVRGVHNHPIVTERRKLGQRKILMEARRRERLNRKMAPKALDWNRVLQKLILIVKCKIRYYLFKLSDTFKKMVKSWMD